MGCIFDHFSTISIVLKRRSNISLRVTLGTERIRAVMKWCQWNEIKRREDKPRNSDIGYIDCTKLNWISLCVLIAIVKRNSLAVVFLWLRLHYDICMKQCTNQLTPLFHQIWNLGGGQKTPPGSISTPKIGGGVSQKWRFSAKFEPKKKSPDCSPPTPPLRRSRKSGRGTRSFWVIHFARGAIRAFFWSFFDPKSKSAIFVKFVKIWCFPGTHFFWHFSWFLTIFVSRDVVSILGGSIFDGGGQFWSKRGSNFRVWFNRKPMKKVPFWVNIHDGFSRTLY